MLEGYRLLARPHMPSHVCLCRNDNQINNRLVILLSKEHGEQKVFWKDVVAGDLIKVSHDGRQLQQQQS
jgi:hypothetical protein